MSLSNAKYTIEEDEIVAVENGKYHFDNIPDELRSLDQWILYSSDGRKVKASDPDNRLSYADAISHFNRGGFDGIGLFLSEADRVVSIEVKHCLDDNGELLPQYDWLEIWLREFSSYTEVCPSDNGLRILIEVKDKSRYEPSYFGEREGIKVYISDTFSAITGNLYSRNGKPLASIKQKGIILDQFIDEFELEKQTKAEITKAALVNGNAPLISDLDDDSFPTILNFGKTVPEPDEYLLYPYLPKNQLSLIFGYSGVLKSTFCRYLAAKFTKGGTLFNQEIDAGSILYLAAEGTARKIYDDVKEFGANQSYINASVIPFCLDKSLLGKKGWLHLLNEIERIKPILIVFDPLYSFLGNLNMNDTQDVIHILNKLQRLCVDYNTTILSVHHPKKDNKNAARLNEMILGSVAWENYHRSIWYVHSLIKAKANDPDAITRSVIYHSKSSDEISGESIQIVRTKEDGFSIEGYPKITEKEILNGYEDNAGIDDHLRRFLPLGEEVEEVEFTRHMQVFGYSPDQIHRARKRNYVACRPEGKGKTRRSILMRVENEEELKKVEQKKKNQNKKI